MFDVVVVPFPFTDINTDKKRPALICSSALTFNRESGHSVMAMITSAENAPWPLDLTITQLQTAGLPKASVIRMKFFTLDNRLIIKKIGTLAHNDAQTFLKSVTSLIPSLQ